MFKRIMIGVLLAALPGMARGQSLSGGRTFHLDLTQPEVVETFSERLSSEGGMVGGHPRTLPLAVRLVSLDRRAYQQGQLSEYEVEITHIGDQPFDLPWSADMVAFEGEGAFDTLTISLQATRPNQVKQFFASIMLLGARSQPGSQQTLMPGDKVVIRVSRRVVLGPETLEEATSAVAPFPVHARVTFESKPDESRWTVVESTNSIPVRFRSRPNPKPRQ